MTITEHKLLKSVTRYQSSPTESLQSVHYAKKTYATNNIET